jgi:hypothetical protein
MIHFKLFVDNIFFDIVEISSRNFSMMQMI